MKDITTQQVEDLAFRFAQEHLSLDEPIPDSSTGFANKLESCLITPFMKFGGRHLYPSFADKAAIMFYLLIKNHPFQNGNKRIAIAVLLALLGKNGKWLDAEPVALYNFTAWIAESPPEAKEGTVQAIRDFIARYMTKLE
jgi:death-on-curing family protein